MAEIYLISNTPNKSVKNLKVCEIKFEIFELAKNYDAIIFTSKNAIKSLKFNDLMPNLKTQIFVIGVATFKEALNFGFENIYLAKARTGNAFACEISHLLKRKKVLYLKAKKTASKIEHILQNDGVKIECVTAYENVFVKCDISQKPPLNSVLIFASPLNVKNFIKNFGWEQSYKAIAIGETTAKFLQKYTTPKISQTPKISDCIELARTFL